MPYRSQLILGIFLHFTVQLRLNAIKHFLTLIKLGLSVEHGIADKQQGKHAEETLSVNLLREPEWCLQCLGSLEARGGNEAVSKYLRHD